MQPVAAGTSDLFFERLGWVVSHRARLALADAEPNSPGIAPAAGRLVRSETRRWPPVQLLARPSAAPVSRGAPKIAFGEIDLADAKAGAGGADQGGDQVGGQLPRRVCSAVKAAGNAPVMAKASPYRRQTSASSGPSCSACFFEQRQGFGRVDRQTPNFSAARISTRGSSPRPWLRRATVARAMARSRSAAPTAATISSKAWSSCSSVSRAGRRHWAHSLSSVHDPPDQPGVGDDGRQNRQHHAPKARPMG